MDRAFAGRKQDLCPNRAAPCLTPLPLPDPVLPDALQPGAALRPRPRPGRAPAAGRKWAASTESLTLGLHRTRTTSGFPRSSPAPNLVP